VRKSVRNIDLHYDILIYGNGLFTATHLLIISYLHLHYDSPVRTTVSYIGVLPRPTLFFYGQRSTLYFRKKNRHWMFYYGDREFSK